MIGIVINEKAAQILGYEHPVGEMIETEGEGQEQGLFGNKRLIIKGVVRDAHTKSLHREIDPQVYIKLTDDAQLGSAIFFKTNDNPQQAIRCIEQKWKEREGDYPFEYRFLDDTYKQLYTGEMNAGKVFTFALLITLIITVAGLFAMAYYATQRRVREIAIRKVYGASVKDLFVLLNRNFVLWVVLAFALACPVAWYALHKWLEKFVVKASLNIWIFLSVGAIALLITLFTTGYQTWKVATENPVKSLKIE
jgi:putative ABC transport system permease protein